MTSGRGARLRPRSAPNSRGVRAGKVRSAVKAGGLGTINHNRSGLKVRTAVKAGGFGAVNHNRSAR